MYVCLCNGFTERDVNRVLAEGANSPSMVYRALESSPQCGRCKSQIKEMLSAFDGKTVNAGSVPTSLRN